MKSYTKKLKTKRELAEIMVRPLGNIPEKYSIVVIEKTMMLPQAQFLREAKKATNLDIVPFLNNTYAVRYQEKTDKAEYLPLTDIMETLRLRKLLE